MRKNFNPPLNLLLTKMTAIFFCIFVQDSLTNQIQSADFEGDGHHQKCRIRNRKVSEAPSESSFKQLEHDIKSTSRLAMVLGFFQPLLTWRAGCYMWNYDQFPKIPPHSIAAMGPMAVVFTYGVLKYIHDKNTAFDQQISKVSAHQRGNIDKLKHRFSIEKNIILTVIALEFCLLTYGIIFEPDIMSNIFPGPKK
ncbi:hypothetical protein [Candidatus Finniella inopinata]|uniref:Uncharacterized protein n=1 Tax=Candidatus Finniella inopinata TaxID=1696036 RepID=A0A4V2E003_9PROT|nr:hypothetical protein [Candidatus Finniella inopinata]RZI46857.1 hypothetical protein EQU50_01130 [Candidatus Finniella inopinata]